MRGLTLSVAAVLVALASAASTPAAVYNFDSGLPSQPQDAPTLDPETIRLILSRRFGVSRYHNLKDVDEAELQKLDGYSGQQQPLFDDGQGKSRVPKLLVMVEGVEDIEDIIPKRRIRPSIYMSTPPCSSTNAKLGQAILQQLADSATTKGCFNSTSWERAQVGVVSNIPEGQTQCCANLARYFTSDVMELDREQSLSNSNVFAPQNHVLDPKLWCGEAVSSVLRLTSLQMLVKSDGPSSAAYKKEAARLSAFLAPLADKAKNGQQETVVILFPPSTHRAKRSTDSSYGDLSFSKRQPTEEPLEVSPAAASSSSSSSSGSSSTTTTTSSSSSSSTAFPSHPLPSKGPIPVCYTSSKSCNELTNQCSGHGRCIEKYKSQPDDDLPKSCWACQCGTTVILPSSQNGNKGNKTIYWGGAACQKKDVSGPFFLLIAMTVFLVGAVAWGVGLLYSIGQEELPSVIGAGISGKTPK